MSVSEVLCNVIPKAEISIEKGDVFNYPTHTHAHYEMTLYEPFEGGITVNGEFFEIRVPTAFLVSPFDFHRIRVEKEPCSSKFIKIGFYEKSVRDFKGLLPNQPIILQELDNHSILTELFEEIYDNNDSTDYVSTLINAAMFYFLRHGKTIISAIPGKKHELTVKVLRYLNRNYTSEITLKKTAQEFSVSPQYLSAVFAAEVGMGFSAYVTDLRLKRAAELLIQGNLNTTEICYACGYRNLSHFLRSFKQRFGTTPKNYQARNAKSFFNYL